MLTDPWIAALLALFLWWFSTGVILMVVKYADRRGLRFGQVLTWLALPIFFVDRQAAAKAHAVECIGALNKVCHLVVCAGRKHQASQKKGKAAHGVTPLPWRQGARIFAP